MNPDTTMGSTEPKARKACVNCRRQKMRCRIENEEMCRRCKRSGLRCVFVPRANAAKGWDSREPDPSQAPSTGEKTISDILQRIKAIEEHIGIDFANEQSDEDFDHSDEHSKESHEARIFEPLWQTAARLQRIAPAQSRAGVWSRELIKHLFQTFHQKMPGFHFLPDRQRYSSPHPILLASMLYCSSVRGPVEVAGLAPRYFEVLCIAISQLALPNSDIGTAPRDPAEVEEWAYQTILGLILGGLLAEANINETGIWISIAYRLVLQHCPHHNDERAHDWRKLFSGLQIVDLEHASLHLSSPVIPIEPPLASLKTSNRDQLYRLSRMMHTGLAHFTGRNIPTIWSCFTANGPVLAQSSSQISAASFTAVDAAVIRDWARQLDQWLVDFTKDLNGDIAHRNLVFRQYVLHRLVVLSIYHPARGCDLYANNFPPHEQLELLLSARATIKLHINDKTIWSNWDLVMITWAALIVLQASEGGVGDIDDLKNVRYHLDSLRQTCEPTPNIRDTLASNLEKAIQQVNVPSFDNSLGLQIHKNAEISILGSNDDYPMTIFDEHSLGQMMFPIWSSLPADPSIV